jgi:HSP20 family protein
METQIPGPNLRKRAKIKTGNKQNSGGNRRLFVTSAATGPQLNRAAFNAKKENRSMPDVKIENRSSEQQRGQGTALAPQRTGILATPEYFPTTRDLFANPFSLMRRLTDEMDRAFHTSWGLGREMGSFWPAMEVKERDGNLVVCADLPGLNKDDVRVETTDEGLVIHGERKREREEKSAGWHHSERSYGEFYRTIPLPQGAHTDRAQAQFRDGVLEVKIPLPESAQHKTREIPIKG